MKGSNVACSLQPALLMPGDSIGLLAPMPRPKQNAPKLLLVAANAAARITRRLRIERKVKNRKWRPFARFSLDRGLDADSDFGQCSVDLILMPFGY